MKAQGNFIIENKKTNETITVNSFTLVDDRTLIFDYLSNDAECILYEWGRSLFHEEPLRKSECVFDIDIYDVTDLQLKDMDLSDNLLFELKNCLISSIGDNTCEMCLDHYFFRKDGLRGILIEVYPNRRLVTGNPQSFTTLSGQMYTVGELTRNMQSDCDVDDFEPEDEDSCFYSDWLEPDYDDEY